MSETKSVPGITKNNHVKFKSLTFNDTQIPVGTTGLLRREYPTPVSLLTCSHKYGYFVATTTDGFVLGETVRLRQLLRASNSETTVRQMKSVIDVRLNLSVQHLRLSGDELRVIACLSGGKAVVYNIKDILVKKDTVEPKWSFHMGNDILDFQLCPAAGMKELAIVLVKSPSSKTGDTCYIINWHTGFIKANVLHKTVTSMCWSPTLDSSASPIPLANDDGKTSSGRGQQFVCGLSDGSLHFYSAIGLKMYEIPSPYSKDEPLRYVKKVICVDKDTLLVIYTNENGNEARIVKRPATPGECVKFELLGDVAPSIPSICSGSNICHHGLAGYTGASKLPEDQNFYIHVIREFSDDVKCAIIVASTASHGIMIVGQEKSGNWATWECPGYSNHFYHRGNNDNNNRSNGGTKHRQQPVTAKSVTRAQRQEQLHEHANTFEIVYPVGMVVDYSTTPSAFGATTFDQISPVLYYITNEGMLKGYHIQGGDDGDDENRLLSVYSGMVRVKTLYKEIPSPPPTGRTSLDFAGIGLANTSNPFVDAVELQQQGGTRKPLPPFKTLQTRPGVRSPPSSIVTAVPTFGKPTMLGFSFGKTDYNKPAATRFGETSFSFQENRSPFGGTVSESTRKEMGDKYLDYQQRRHQATPSAMDNKKDRMRAGSGLAFRSLSKSKMTTTQGFRGFSSAAPPATNTDDRLVVSGTTGGNGEGAATLAPTTGSSKFKSMIAKSRELQQKQLLSDDNGYALLVKRDEALSFAKAIVTTTPRASNANGAIESNTATSAISKANQHEQQRSASPQPTTNTKAPSKPASKSSLSSSTFTSAIASSGTDNETNLSEKKQKTMGLTDKEGASTFSSIASSDSAQRHNKNATNEPDKSDGVCQSNVPSEEKAPPTTSDNEAHDPPVDQANADSITVQPYKSSAESVTSNGDAAIIGTDDSTLSRGTCTFTANADKKDDETKIPRADSLLPAETTDNSDYAAEKSAIESPSSSSENNAISASTVTGLGVLPSSSSDTRPLIDGEDNNVVVGVNSYANSQNNYTNKSKSDDDNADDVYERALALLKGTNDTYAALLHDLRSLVHVKGAGGAKENGLTSNNNDSVSPPPRSHQQKHIKANNVPPWLHSLGQSITQLEDEIVEKEIELRRMKQNLKQIVQVYDNAMDETNVKASAAEESSRQELYGRVANRLRHEAFIDELAQHGCITPTTSSSVTGDSQQYQEQNSDKGKGKEDAL